MTEGIFSLIFKSHNEQLGSGFAAFKNGRIRGGDEEFSYDGTYQLLAPNSQSVVDFKAEVNVQYYQGVNLAIFGKLTRFSINLSGEFVDNEISAHGKINKFVSIDIDLIGAKINDFQFDSPINNDLCIFDNTLFVLDKEIKPLLNSAFNLYSNSSYVDAANTFFCAINSTVTKLLNMSGEKNERHLEFLDKIDILIKRKMLPTNSYSSFQALVISDKVLDKKSNAPEDCAFPLCITALNLLTWLDSAVRNTDVLGD